MFYSKSNVKGRSCLYQPYEALSRNCNSLRSIQCHLAGAGNISATTCQTRMLIDYNKT